MNLFIRWLLIACLLHVTRISANETVVPSIINKDPATDCHVQTAQERSLVRSNSAFVEAEPPALRTQGGGRDKRAHPVFGEAGPPGHRKKQHQQPAADTSDISLLGGLADISLGGAQPAQEYPPERSGGFREGGKGRGKKPKKQHPVFGEAGPPGHRKKQHQRPPVDDSDYTPEEEAVPSFPSSRPRPTQSPPTATKLPPSKHQSNLASKQGCSASVTKVNGGNQVCSGQVIFEESFDKELDKNYWTKVVKFAGPPDYEFVVYLSDSDTLKVEAGNLKIKPILLGEKYNDDDFVNQQLDLGASCTGIKSTIECFRKAENYIILPPIVSGRINTKGKFSFLYGKVEIRAKLPTGNWIYPELYLSPEEESYGQNYDSGLMRVAYMHGNSADRKTISGGVVIGKTSEARTWFLKSYTAASHISSWASDFHTFVLEWQPDVIELSIDGQKYAEIRPPSNGFAEIGEKFQQKTAAKLWQSGTILAPFDKEFYLDIGVGVGGENFPDSTQKPWKNTSPKGMLDFWNKKNTWFTTWDDNSQLQVDYIRVTAL